LTGLQLKLCDALKYKRWMVAIFAIGIVVTTNVAIAGSRCTNLNVETTERTYVFNERKSLSEVLFAFGVGKGTHRLYGKCGWVAVNKSINPEIAQWEAVSIGTKIKIRFPSDLLLPAKVEEENPVAVAGDVPLLDVPPSEEPAPVAPDPEPQPVAEMPPPAPVPEEPQVPWYEGGFADGRFSKVTSTKIVLKDTYSVGTDVGLRGGKLDRMRLSLDWAPYHEASTDTVGCIGLGWSRIAVSKSWRLFNSDFFDLDVGPALGRLMLRSKFQSEDSLSILVETPTSITATSAGIQSRATMEFSDQKIEALVAYERNIPIGGLSVAGQSLSTLIGSARYQYHFQPMDQKGWFLMGYFEVNRLSIRDEDSIWGADQEAFSVNMVLPEAGFGLGLAF
jgi:hypothetical protein